MLPLSGLCLLATRGCWAVQRQQQHWEVEQRLAEVYRAAVYVSLSRNAPAARLPGALEEIGGTVALSRRRPATWAAHPRALRLPRG